GEAMTGSDEASRIDAIAFFNRASPMLPSTITMLQFGTTIRRFGSTRISPRPSPPVVLPPVI
ncbi:MAG TPA: hypothetical protein VM910_14890, partial [Bradyrhizobium sp.]|nr:hypothetical protein [Bradyrhizobium sp.]